MMKFKTIIAICFLSLGIMIPMALPAQGETTFDDVKSAAETCFKDYYQFSITVKTNQMRGEVYKDMTRSWCQINDLLPLYDEYDAIKDAYRADASNCGTVDNYEKTRAEYEFEMKRILLEQEFIRNVRVEARNTQESNDIDKLKGTIISSLKDKMSDLYVEDEEMVTQAELDEMFEVWINKYNDTLHRYTICDEGPIWELVEVWFSYQQTIQSLDFEIEKPERKSFMEVIKPDVDATGVVDGWKDGVQNVTDSWNSLMDNFRHAEQEDESEEKEDRDEQEEQGEDPDALPNTFDAYMQALKENASSDDVYGDSMKRMAEYETLYGEIGAVTTTQSVIILDQLNQTINNNNIQDFPAIREALDDIYGKQCSG